MDKRYQVFVSSPYDGLREERSKVMHKLLEMNCIPSGMELFPAADDDAWSLIKSVIDECDYYILILAGRYGSTDEEGVGFTEKEYRYAVERGKPVAAFLHSSPGHLAVDDSEKSDKGRKKLDAFRELAKKKHCKFWSNSDELASVVTVSMVHLMNRNPGVGWIRADLLPADDILTETIRLQKRVGELEHELKEYEDGPLPGTVHLARGMDRVCLTFLGLRRANVKITIETDWDTIIDSAARDLLRSFLDDGIASTLTAALERQIADECRRHYNDENTAVYLSPDSRELIRIQFRALGIATQKMEWFQDENTGEEDSDYRWALTPYGDRFIAQRLAIRREAASSREH